jgi:regulator of cell morphogenesis and NO signaling
MNDRLDSVTVGEIVAGDFRTAAVFEQHGIDFCCGGRQTLGDACRAASADPAAVLAALDALPSGEAPADDPASWPIDQLIEHIVKVHHGYVRSSLPTIGAYLRKLQSVHGERHPELARIVRHFGQVSVDLEQHMMKEEHVLFPYIIDLAHAGGAAPDCPFGTVENPIRMMETEHRDAADELQVIRDLTNGYAVPADGCTTYAACMRELDRFERDLHRHVHLENNVLFPKSLALEAGLEAA